MRKIFPLLAVLCAILAFNCIAQAYRISAQEEIIATQKEVIQKERDAYRLYERRCDSLIARYDSLCNELMK